RRPRHGRHPAHGLRGAASGAMRRGCAMSTAWVAGIGLVAMMGFAFAGGASWSHQRASERVADAKASAAVCEDQLRSKANAMDQVRGQLADLADRHARALAAATAALDQRDA